MKKKVLFLVVVVVVATGLFGGERFFRAVR